MALGMCADLAAERVCGYRPMATSRQRCAHRSQDRQTWWSSCRVWPDWLPAMR
jgi:hypothetical protein